MILFPYQKKKKIPERPPHKCVSLHTCICISKVKDVEGCLLLLVPSWCGGRGYKGGTKEMLRETLYVNITCRCFWIIAEDVHNFFSQYYWLTFTRVRGYLSLLLLTSMVILSLITWKGLLLKWSFCVTEVCHERNVFYVSCAYRIHHMLYPQRTLQLIDWLAKLHAEYLKLCGL